MRILLVKTSSLGDVVHNLPVVTDIKQHLPDAHVDWVVEEAFADIPRLHPGVARVIPVALRRWRHALLSRTSWRELLAMRRLLRRDAYDVVLDTQGLIKSALLARQARLAPGGGRRCGYAAEVAREPLAAIFYRDTYAIPRNAHAVDRNRQLAAAALSFPLDMAPDYGIAATASHSPPAAQPAVLLTATSRSEKLWPETDWVRVGCWLAESGHRVLLPAGSGQERARAERLSGQIPGSKVAPAMRIAELAGLLTQAGLVIGLDTGLTHLAAALGRPTLALFSGSDPGLTGLHAGRQALNLGQAGKPPSVAAVVATLRDLTA